MAEFKQTSDSIIEQVPDSTKAASELGGPQASKLELPDYTSILSVLIGDTTEQEQPKETPEFSFQEPTKAEGETAKASPAPTYKSVLKPILQPTNAPKKGPVIPPALAETAAYIQEAAIKRGIDPNVVLRVVRHEGLVPGVWQSNYKKNGIREPSYGPFQMLVGGPGTGFPTGLGNQFMAKTGLDPSDPKNLHAGIDFSLDHAKQNGWSAWYGAKAAGVGQWEGIKS